MTFGINLEEVPWIGPPSTLPATVRGEIAFDTETSGLHPDDGARVSCVSAAWVDWDRWQIRYAAWPFAQGPDGKPEDNGVRGLFDTENTNLDKQEWYALLDWLSTAGIGIGGHNVKFDLAMARAGVDGLREGTEGWVGVDLTDRVTFDTQVAAKELWPTQATALKGEGSVTWRLFKYEDREKRALKPYLGPKGNPRYDLVPWDVMEPYSAMDSLLTIKVRLLELQAIDRGEVAAGRMSGAYWLGREINLLRVLARMERRGIPYARQASFDAARELRERSRQTERKLGLPASQIKDYWFRVGNDGQPVDVLGFDGQRIRGRGLGPYAVTDKKRDPKLTAEIVDDMVADGVAGAADYRDYVKLGSAASKWYEPYGQGTGNDGRLRTVFRQVASGFEGEGGTRSGRYSVERVNLQAIPHDYRLSDFAILEGIPTPRALIAAAVAGYNAGKPRTRQWQLWELDLAQAELRLAAMWARCERMLRLIREGADLHTDTTYALFGLAKGDAGFGSRRQVAKRANFSLIFGSGWLTFKRMVKVQAGVDLSDSEATRIVTDWNRLYPEFRRAIDAHSRVVEYGTPGAKGMPLVNGRVRWWRGWEDTHKAFNQRVQGSLAELGKDWMIESDEYLRSQGLDERGIKDGIGAGGLLLTIHDSQVLLLPERDGLKLATEVRAIGRRHWQRLFPDVPGDVDIKRWSA